MLKISFYFEKEQERNIDHHILQWFFYNLLWNKKEKYHDLKYSLFNFGNIFPFEKWQNYQAGKLYSIYFKTIEKEICFSVYETLTLKKEFAFWKNNKLIVKKVIYIKDDPIYPGKIIKWITPIIISIYKDLAEKYGIKFKARLWRPMYWIKEMWFDIFVNQLTKNILSKYIFLIERWYVDRLNDFDKSLLEIYKDKNKFEDFVKDIDLFSWYKYKRLASVYYKGIKIPWSIWDFKVNNNLNYVKILHYVSQIWLGERCSAGFGFIL